MDVLTIREKSAKEVQEAILEVLQQFMESGTIDIPVYHNETVIEGNMRKERSGNRKMGPTQILATILLMDLVSKSLKSKISSSYMKRDIYYKFKHVFQSEEQLTTTIKDMCVLCKCPRHCLSILSCSKGAVVGSFRFKNINSGKWTDASLGEQPIPYDTTMTCKYRIEEVNKMKFILVVEKHCVFQQIEQAQLAQKHDFVLITGRGFPDLASRAFTSLLQRTLQIPVYGLCDFNPFGIRLLLSYWIGTSGKDSWPESYLYTVPWLELIGLTAADVNCVPEDHQQELNFTDKKVISSTELLLRKIGTQEKENCEFVQGINNLLDQLKFMDKNNRKCEIEAIVPQEDPSFLTHIWLDKKIRKIHLQLERASKGKRLKLSMKNLYGADSSCNNWFKSSSYFP